MYGHNFQIGTCIILFEHILGFKLDVDIEMTRDVLLYLVFFLLNIIRFFILKSGKIFLSYKYSLNHNNSNCIIV